MAVQHEEQAEETTGGPSQGTGTGDETAPAVREIPEVREREDIYVTHRRRLVFHACLSKGMPFF